MFQLYECCSNNCLIKTFKFYLERLNFILITSCDHDIFDILQYINFFNFHEAGT